MRNWIVAGCLLVFAGCARPESTEPPEQVEPTNRDLQVLQLEGIRDPYSARGQRRIRKLQRDRAQLEAYYEKRREFREMLRTDRDEEEKTDARQISSERPRVPARRGIPGYQMR